jgi:chromosome segregation ATPase
MKFNALDASLLPSNSMKSTLNSILAEVETTDSPKTIKQFLDTIKGMMSKLLGEQAEHEKVSEKMMKQCKEEDEFRSNEIAEAKDASDRATNAKAKCQQSLDETQKGLPDLEGALETYEAELKRVTEQRANEKKAYEQRKNDYEAALNFLEDFMGELNTNMAGFSAFSFAQKATVVLKHASKLGVMQHAVPVLVSLASQQVPTEHNVYDSAKNQDLGDKLKAAVQSLIDRIQADWQKNEDDEAAAVAAFLVLKGKLDNAIAALKENIKQAKKQISEMKKCVEEEGAILGKAQAKLARNSNLKKSAQSMCGTFAKEFIEATNARKEEVETIKEILKIIEKRFGEIPGDLKKYLTSVENGFKEYENSTKFKEFVAYQQIQHENNEEGEELTKEENRVTENDLEKVETPNSSF